MDAGLLYALTARLDEQAVGLRGFVARARAQLADTYWHSGAGRRALGAVAGDLVAVDLAARRLDELADLARAHARIVAAR